MFTADSLGPLGSDILTASDVHVWWADLDRPAWDVTQFWPALSPDEQARAEQFRAERHRSRFVISRGILRALLARYLVTDADQVALAYGPYGKPYVVQPHAGSSLRFNVSHSDCCAVFAFVRNREIGIDVERIRPMPDAELIAESFFSAYERAVLMNLAPEERIEAFYRCWARKEAVIKAVGTGLSIPLDSFDVSVAPGEPAKLLRFEAHPEMVGRWSLRQLNGLHGYAAALMVEGNDWRLRCWNVCAIPEQLKMGLGRK